MYNTSYTLLGVDAETKAAVDGFLAKNPSPNAEDVADLFKLIPDRSWSEVSRSLVANGVSPVVVRNGLDTVTADRKAWIKSGLVLVSATASAFHGARRNDSIVWGAWWFLMGLAFPIFTPIIGVAQGFGKRKG